MLNNNFSYTPLVFAFVPQKDSYYSYYDTDIFFLSLHWKVFNICLWHFYLFYLFLLQKDIDIFHVLLLEAFLCVFDNTYLSFLYIEKNYKKYFVCFKKIIQVICKYFMNNLKSLQMF